MFDNRTHINELMRGLFVKNATLAGFSGSLAAAGTYETKQSYAKRLVALVKYLLVFVDQSRGAFETLQAYMTLYARQEDASFDEFVVEAYQHRAVMRTHWPQLVHCLQARRYWLDEKLALKPAFSWHMPAAHLPEHPLVEQFLRSADSAMYYSGAFASTRDLRHFIAQYRDAYGWSSHQRGFSVNMKEEANLTVLIVKTQQYYQERVKVFDEYEKELNNLTLFLTT